MPDSTIYSESTGNSDDSWHFRNSTSNWADSRGDASTSSNARIADSAAYTAAILSSYLAGGRGGATWFNRRVYMGFDVSGESGTVDSATVKVFLDNYGDTGNYARVVMVESTALGGSTADYGNCFSSGSTLGDLMANYVEVSTTAGFHDFVLNSDGISALNAKIGSGIFEVCFMSNLLDYDNNDPNDGSGDYTQIAFTFAEKSGTLNDPKIEIDYESIATTENAIFFGSNF